MQCPRCGSETASVYTTQRNRTASGNFSTKSDLRYYRCGTIDKKTGLMADGCGKIFLVECVLAGLEVYDAEKMKSLIVSLEIYNTHYLPIESLVRRKQPLKTSREDRE